jgi:hypothetical protein
MGLGSVVRSAVLIYVSRAHLNRHASPYGVITSYAQSIGSIHVPGTLQLIVNIVIPATM